MILEKQLSAGQMNSLSLIHVVQFYNFINILAFISKKRKRNEVLFLPH